MKKLATVDIEANGLDLDKITTVWCASVKDHQTQERYDFVPSTLHELPAKLDEYDELAFHGGTRYDLPVLKKVMGYEPRGKIHDTLLMSRLQRPNRVLPKEASPKSGPHSVHAWGIRLSRPKPEHEEWDRWSPTMSRRCAEDCEIQYLIFEELKREGEGEGWDNAHRLVQRMFHYLFLQERRGWNFDSEFARHSIHRLDRWIRNIDRAVAPSLPVLLEILETKKDGEYNYVRKPFLKSGEYSESTKKFLGYCDQSEPSTRSGQDQGEATGSGRLVAGPFSRIRWRRVDLDSSSEVKQFLLDQGWEPDEWNTDNEGKRTSPKLSKTDDFSGVSGALGRLIVRRVQCKQRKGILEGWLAAVRDDGRIPTPVAGLASTGRLRHALVVNVPSPETKSFFAREMRRCFIATPGMQMVGVDSKGNQIRQLAARMGDEEFTRAVLYGSKEEGTDIHSLNQARCGATTRTTAKNWFYGLIFGAGQSRLNRYGSAAKQTFLNRLPKLRNLIGRLEQQWSKTARKVYNSKTKRVELSNGYIQGLDGRPIQIDSQHKLLVGQLQSDEAIQMAGAYCYIHKRMEELGYIYGEDWGSCIWYHDEFQMEAKPSAISDLERIMVESIAWSGRYFKIGVPHEGESKKGYSWAETH